MRMFDRAMMFDLIYALAARDGRETALFGESAPLARQAFVRSLAGTGFPELWFELPCAGDPWFDLHALASREHLDPFSPFAPETCGNCPGAFEWFAAQERGVRQLALSWDTGSGGATDSADPADPANLADPAVQLLTGTGDVEVTGAFLAAAGREDAADAFRLFSERLPESWCACYAGVFPQRTTPFLRVECIPNINAQRVYAEDAALLEAHLRQVGLAALGDTVVPRTHVLARTPFRLEFQFDVDPSGRADVTFSASVRFQPPSEERARECFDPNGEAGALMQQVESWGLADGRWRLMAQAAFAQRVSAKDASAVIYCYPAFIKLRWKGGEPHDAKAYLIAGVQ